MEQIKGVIFDMDGLMFDSERVYKKANVLTAQKLNMACDADYFTQFVGVGEQDMAQMMLKDFDQETIDQFFKQGAEDARRLLLSGDVATQKGLYELLEMLAQHDIPLIVASSSHTDIVKKMTTNAAIDHYFVDRIGGDQVEHTKPNPAIFLKAHDILGTPKSSTLVLEDSINGVRAAYQADLPVIMVPDTVLPTDECTEKTVDIMPDLLAVKNWIMAINNYTEPNH